VIAYELVTSADRLPAIAREIERAKVVGFDIETTSSSASSFEPFARHQDGSEARIRLLSVNTGKGLYVIDLDQTKTLGPILTALASEKVIKVVQNAKFEQKWFLHKYDLELWPIFDPYRASNLVYNGLDRDHDLWSLYEHELKLTPQTEDLGGSDWSRPILTPQQLEYSAEDSLHLLDLRSTLREKLRRKGLFKVALIEFGAVLPESVVELNGLPLDQDMWLELCAQNTVKAEELRKELVWKLPNPRDQMTLPGIEPAINLNSPQQVLNALRRVGGDLSDLENTREITLAMHAAKHPEIQLLLDYRTYSKRVTQFGKEYLRHIDPVTGRIHSSYYPFTGAGRYASSKPNLQQIPRAFAFRDCFRAPLEWRMVGADYSNIEMRLCAQIANDKNLIAIFNSEDDDAHRATAALMAGCTKDKVTKKQRQEAKPVNFGLIYGMQPPKLVLYAMANYGVTMSLQAAKRYRKKFFEGYSGVASWHEYTINAVKPKKLAKTIAGRIRYLTKEDAHNEFFNTPVQGSGADGLKASLREVYLRLKKVSAWNGDIKMVHHVHDEIILQTKDDDEVDREARKILVDGMVAGMAPILTKVPIKVEPESGPSWGAAKG
jgi:DNA polymerase I-like protein with 3'-5' exonuclease and polymerase domains